MKSFFYQIGSITTDKGWFQPSYEVVRAFFQDNEISPLAIKYKILIVGGFLYKKTTGDLDLYLLHDYDENTDWSQVEEDMNTLNNIALNRYSLLLDISVTNKPISLFSKRELIEYNKDKPFEDWLFPRITEDNQIFIKIPSYKKIIDGKVQFDTMEYDFSQPSEKYNESNFGKFTKLTTNGYLYKIDRRATPHRHKLLETIMRTNISDDINHNLSYEKFLSMSSEDFHDSLIHLNDWPIVVGGFSYFLSDEAKKEI